MSAGKRGRGAEEEAREAKKRAAGLATGSGAGREEEEEEDGSEGSESGDSDEDGDKEYVFLVLHHKEPQDTLDATLPANVDTLIHGAYRSLENAIEAATAFVIARFNGDPDELGKVDWQEEGWLREEEDDETALNDRVEVRAMMLDEDDGEGEDEEEDEDEDEDQIHVVVHHKEPRDTVCKRWSSQPATMDTEVIGVSRSVGRALAAAMAYAVQEFQEDEGGEQLDEEELQTADWMGEGWIREGEAAGEKHDDRILIMKMRIGFDADDGSDGESDGGDEEDDEEDD